ncbi:hypothetical protein ACH5RR_023195 [Cinchona calisaya]|uniref:DNA-directed RNA polymerase n=1 Tax=Cinchona calisaya TaxID=153742 RepID=A0ABD2ZB19_9GENT
MAMKTNLIQYDNTIQDIYQYMLGELKEFLPNELDGNLSKAVCDLLTRKIVKGIFMPIIYGKTLMSTTHDLKEHLSDYVTHKECFAIAKACFKFWIKKYPGVDCLIRLLRHIGWLTFARARPVIYSEPYFMTVQEYMVMESINIWVYDRVHKKRRRVSMRVSSSKMDRRKSAISTFVNFIHQKDASIAMSVVDKMLQTNHPIDTVHDNFITTPAFCLYMPYLYASTISDMEPPLRIINEFIYINVINPLRQCAPTSSEIEGINGILAAYAEYTRIVCFDPRPNMTSWMAHERNWAYTTGSSTSFELLMSRMKHKINRTTRQDPHDGLIIAFHHFKEPYPLIEDISLLSLCTMDLLVQVAYPCISGYGKFTISFTMMKNDISYTLGAALPLTYEDGNLIPMSDVYSQISRYMNKYSEIYEGDYVVRLMIRVYTEGKKKDVPSLSEEDKESTLSSIIQGGLREIDPISAREIRNSKKRLKPSYIIELKSSRTKLKAFIVADTETILIDEVHKVV